MFYYHNPLTFPSGAPRLPSLELPFSSTQPCKNFLIIFQYFRFFRRLFLSEPYDGEHLEIHHEFGFSFWDLAMNSFYGLLEIRTHRICHFLISYFPLTQTQRWLTTLICTTKRSSEENRGGTERRSLSSSWRWHHITYHIISISYYHIYRTIYRIIS